jgi:hypothetical protein
MSLAVAGRVNKREGDYMADWYTMSSDGTVTPANGMQTDRWQLKDEVGGYRVSTVFLSLDHSFDEGDPILWETMVFPMASFDDLYCARYRSADAAIKGHARVVEALRTGIRPEELPDEDEG